MASVKVYHGKRGTTYQLTLYKGYMEISGKKKQIKETVTHTLDEMGIDGFSSRGNPRSEATIMKEVKLYADNLEKRMIGGNYTRGDKITLLDFYNQSWKPWAENHFQASTYSKYTRQLDQIIIPSLGSLRLAKITPETISDFYRKLVKQKTVSGRKDGYSRRSVETFHSQLYSVMRLALKYKIIESNPCRLAELPNAASKKKVKHLTQEQAGIFLYILDNPPNTIYKTFYKDRGVEYEKIMDFGARKDSRILYEMYKVMFRIALFSGCRCGELRALTWNDIDFEHGVIKITKAVAYSKIKGGNYIKEPKTEESNREVVIPEEEINSLRELKKSQMGRIAEMGTAWKGETRKNHLDENLIFCQLNGNIMWACSPNELLNRLIENYNMTVEDGKRLPHISMHCLRHTSATLLVSSGMDVRTISSRLGHKNIETTLQIYSHQLKKRDEQASKVLASMLGDKPDIQETPTQLKMKEQA